MDLIHQFRWRPQIGDPSLMGWLTVFAYGAAAFTCWLAARRAARAPGTTGGSRANWIMIALLMAFLCLNKQLDLQSLFTDIGRVMSRNQGWYQQRREFQKYFVIGVLGFSFLTTAFLFVRYRQFWKQHFLLGAGLAFLLTFIVVRAVSFHHIDVLLKVQLAGLRMNWIFELTGITLVWLAAWRDYRNPMRPPKPPWKPASS